MENETPRPDLIVRAAVTADLERMKEIAVAAEMFTSDEVSFFDEMFGGFVDGTLDGHNWLVAQLPDGPVIGAAQFAPEPFADRMWNLYFIAVDPRHQGKGIGSRLMHDVETDLGGRGSTVARTLVVETSSTDQYARTRQFYLGLGYDEEARIRDFYGPGDNKVVFWKSLV